MLANRMPDFGPRWIDAQPLDKGGQAQTFTVGDADNPGGPLRVAKIVNNPRPARKERFLREIEVTERFVHPNVVSSIAKGETKNNKFPYFIMPYYDGGTLEKSHAIPGTSLERLRCFLAICEGVAYAHAQGLIHRDLKPANIFMTAEGVPIVGDFGLVYRSDADPDGRYTQTSEAVGARKYMPPEWREGRVEDPQPTGDIYSLGKILYWLFAGRVFDGNEDDHTELHPLVKTNNVLLNQSEASAAWTYGHSVAAELVVQTIQKRPDRRLATVTELIGKVKAAIDRVENGGRPLDFNLPKRCLFCASGSYEWPKNIPFFSREDRRTHRQKVGEQWAFSSLQYAVRNEFGFGAERPGLIPICLVCNVCGNIQCFRFDLTSDKWGEAWNP